MERSSTEGPKSHFHHKRDWNGLDVQASLQLLDWLRTPFPSSFRSSVETMFLPSNLFLMTLISVAVYFRLDVFPSVFLTWALHLRVSYKHFVQSIATWLGAAFFVTLHFCFIALVGRMWTFRSFTLNFCCHAKVSVVEIDQACKIPCIWLNHRTSTFYLAFHQVFSYYADLAIFLTTFWLNGDWGWLWKVW